MSVREATNLETTLRGAMESYSFQLWIVTALFRFLGDSGCCPMDDPLLDQFQRSFSRGAENLAAALASSTALVSAKRRESFLTHMFPSVTDAQKRKLLSDPLFDQKDLFAPASIEAAREAARDFSLYRGAQSRPSTSSGPHQRRRFNAHNSRGRHNTSPRFHITRLTELTISFRPFPAKEGALRSPQETRGFLEVGAFPLAQHRRLPRPFLAGLDGSGGGCLGRGGLTRGVHDLILSETPLARPTSPHALLFPVVHQGKSFGEGVHRSPPQGSHRTGSPDSRLLQSPIRGPEGLRVRETHHRPVYPEHVHSVATGFYKAYGSNICHSPSLRYQDPPILRRLVNSNRIQYHLYSCEGQAPAPMRGARTTSEPRKVITVPISGHDLPRNGNSVSSVHCKTNRDKNREPPQDNRGVFSRPQAPQHLYTNVLGNPTTAGSRSFPTSAGFELRLRCFRHRVGGGVMGGQQVSGGWTPCQKRLSINLREMMAVHKGLLGLSQFLRGKTIALFCDNVTTVPYLRRS